MVAYEPSPTDRVATGLAHPERSGRAGIGLALPDVSLDVTAGTR